MECMHCGDPLTNDNLSLWSDFHCVDCLYPPNPPMTIAEALEDQKIRRNNDVSKPRPLWAQKLAAGEEARHDW